VVLSCLCGQAEQKVTLAAEVFPVQTLLCHCNTCRSSSGVLCSAYLPLAEPATSLANLTSYDTGAFSRLFCRTCGAHVLARDKATNAYFVSSGTIEHSGDVVQIMGHEYVADTADGGLAICLTNIGYRRLVQYARSQDQPATFSPTNHRDAQSGSWPRLGRDEKLHASCHCGGVKYFVTQPNEASRQLSSPFPDLLVPYHSGSPDNHQNVKWWMREEDTKYLAGTCACRSCRLAVGFPIQTWAFIPKLNIMSSDSEPLNFSTGSLRQYESSPGIYREFCSVCGATAFWHCDERPHLIDVSVGLLKSPKGARAEDWLDWETGRVSFKEEALDQELVTALEQGLQAIKNDQ